MQAIQNLRGAATDAAAKLGAEAVVDKVGVHVGKVGEMTSSAARQVGDIASQRYAEFAEQFEKQKGKMLDLLEKLIKHKFAEKAEVLVDLIPGVLKKSLDDKDMPDVVRLAQNRIIDSIWPDLKEEIMWEIDVMIDGDDSKTQKQLEEGYKPDCIRSYLRYRIYPFDKTVWGKIRHPVWLLFTLLSLVPTFNIYVVTFFCVFLLIDKSDTFQLVYFILSFKGNQFISHGIIRTIIGFSQFIACVTAVDNFQSKPKILIPALKEGSGTIQINNVTQVLVNITEGESVTYYTHTCHLNGPGVAGNYVWIFAAYLLQVSLVWIAMLLLYRSKDKGKPLLEGNIQHKEMSKAATLHGGYMQRLLIYDLVIFLICATIFGIIAAARMSSHGGTAEDAANPERHDWVLKQMFFVVQIIYGFMSFPFFFFNLPLLQQILTHVRPTGYNRYGQACLICLPPAEPDKDAKTLKERLQEKMPANMLSAGEGDRVMEQVKRIVRGESADLSEFQLSRRARQAAAKVAPQTVGTTVPGGVVNDGV